MQSEKFKVTPLERSWILYDVGNSAFVLMIATLVPIFFNALAEAGGLSPVNYLAYWGYASSVVTVITAVLGPILGTLADTRGFKKPIFMLCLFVGVAGCCAMGLATTWLPFLIIFILAKIGFSGSLVFYDSMLGDVTTPERMDVVSSQGYAWGYIGSCVPFVVCLALVLGSGAIGLSQMTALSVALLITAVWWLGTTLPLLRSYKQINYVEVEQHAIRQSFVRIGHTLKHLRYGHRLRHGTGAGDHRPFAGPAGNADRSLPFGADLWSSKRKISVQPAYPGLHRSLHRHCGVRLLPDQPVAILGTGRAGGHVPGRRAGTEPQPLCQDHPG